MKVDEEEMRAVVSPPADENVFLKTTFSELESTRFQKMVGYRACQGTSREDNISKSVPEDAYIAKLAKYLYVVKSHSD